jgi:NAD+ synthase
MDLCMYAHNGGIAAAAVAEAVGLSEADVERVFHDIEAKRRATAYLHMQPRLVQPIPEIGH